MNSTNFLRSTRTYLYAGLSLLVIVGLYLASLYNYLLFHTLAEMFSIVVAGAIFLLVWNARRVLDNAYLLFIGVAYLFVGGIDLVHTLAYKGMGVFQEYEANLSTQLWIAGRYVESLSLLIPFAFLDRRIRLGGVFSAYTVAVGLLLLSIFYWKIFPVCFVEGQGLTEFKVVSEYVISLILFTALVMLIKTRAQFDPRIVNLLVLSIVTTIGAEAAFTFYVHVYGFSNLVGHYLKIASFFFIYRAVIETGLRKPYALLFRELKEQEEAVRASEQRYRSLFQTAPVGIATITPVGNVLGCNNAFRRMFDYSDSEIRQVRVADLYGDAERHSTLLEELKNEGRVRNFEAVLKKKDGGTFFGTLTVTPITWDEREAFLSVVEDVTQRRHQEDELRRYRNELEELVRERTDELAKANEQLADEIEGHVVADRALREAELQYRTLADFTYDWVYWILPDESLRYVSPSCERITGFTAEEFMRNPGLLQDIMVPEDAEVWTDHRRDAVEELKTREIQFRIRTRSGDVRWIEHACRPVIEEQGRFSGFRVSNRDITERKRVEGALRKSEEALRKSREEYRVLAGRLLSAQEEARRRLARELHDDLTQRLAVLSINAAKLEQDLRDHSPDTTIERIRQVKDDMVRLSADVHAIARQLHPSILDDLGLVDAVASACTSFAQSEGIRVSYTPWNVPATLSKDVALAVYRIVQEGLNNIAKHAQATDVAVSLQGGDGAVHLSIQDNGVGFDPLKAKRQGGLGLASMRERIYLVRGKLSIKTRPGQGTEIRVRVPVKPGGH